ncbi:hypothetical protein CDL12_02503 [Handroanthus impetiginosus]|uniref:Uncharacterized protein n=1 Tax=Handroanthus impetiginosus TaxID=429701 RepID=A0A2G9I4S3_9LAMI|nr:hypothetical protein CDL12_02503 [Handroanthus impetiginosus]
MLLVTLAFPFRNFFKFQEISRLYRFPAFHSPLKNRSRTIRREQEMRKRSTRKPSAASLLTSPLPPPSAKVAAITSPTLSPAESPAVQFDFNLNGFADIETSLTKKSNKNGTAGASGSKRVQPTGFSPSPLKNVNTISDLKDLASSNLDSIKRQLERSYSAILKDTEASQCRLQKRFKIQTQACQQVMDEAEKEYKKMSDRINEGQEAMKASYAEFIAEAQATASRLCKTSIPELAKASEKGINSLRNRFGISSTAS